VTGSALELATGGGARTRRTLRVAIAGFGSIGRLVGRHLDEGVQGLRLVSVSAANLDRAREKLKVFRARVDAVPLERIADVADVVVDCAVPQVFREAVTPAIERGRTIVTVNATSLMSILTLLIAPSGPVRASFLCPARFSASTRCAPQMLV
jgi:homoserine dehydrogenase